MADFGCHGVVVKITPDSRCEDEARSRLGDAESDLSVSVDVDNRVLDCAEARQRKAQDDCFDPSGQLPGDRSALSYSQSVQTCRNSFGFVAELCIGELPTGIVD